MKRPRPQSLPADVSLAELQFLLGLTRARIGQLEDEGVIERTARGRYAIESVPCVLADMRRRTAGPKAWQDVRVELAREKLATARLERQRREGEMIHLGWAVDLISRNFRAARDRIARMPTKLAPIVHAQPSVPRCYQALDAACTEICDSLAEEREADLIGAIKREAAAEAERVKS